MPAEKNMAWRLLSTNAQFYILLNNLLENSIQDKLRLSVKFNAVAHVKWYLNQGASVHHIEPSSKMGLLHYYFLYRSSPEILKVLLVSGIDPNQTDANGATPLYHCLNDIGKPDAPQLCNMNIQEKIRLLVAAGASAELAEKNNKTAKMRAKEILSSDDYQFLCNNLLIPLHNYVDALYSMSGYVRPLKEQCIKFFSNKDNRHLIERDKLPQELIETLDGPIKPFRPDPLWPSPWQHISNKPEIKLTEMDKKQIAFYQQGNYSKIIYSGTGRNDTEQTIRFINNIMNQDFDRSSTKEDTPEPRLWYAPTILDN